MIIREQPERQPSAGHATPTAKRMEIAHDGLFTAAHGMSRGFGNANGNGEKPKRKKEKENRVVLLWDSQHSRQVVASPGPGFTEIFL